MEMIRHKHIRTQQDLCDELKQEGITVTQAQISRDIRDLGIVRMRDAEGIYYAFPGEVSRNVGNQFSQAKYMLLSVASSGNIVSVKTIPGAAQIIGHLIDEAGIPGVIGCVAGDDTVMLVARNEEAVEEVVNELQRVLTVE